MEAKTAPKKRRGHKKRKAPGSAKGPKVLVHIGSRQFYAHKKTGDPAKKAALKRNNPLVYYRGQAAKEVAAEMKQAGQPVRITDKGFQSRVKARYNELLSINHIQKKS